MKNLKKNFFGKELVGILAMSLMTAPFSMAAPNVNAANKGPNQMLAEGKQMLFERAYRIDKELVSQSDFRNNLDIVLKSHIFRPDETLHFDTALKSEAYQTHDKANTWVILALDKESFHKNQDSINNSKLIQESRCAKEGLKFLNELEGQYKTMSASDLETLSGYVSSLSQAKAKAAQKADQSGVLNPLAEPVDDFLAQRIQLVRIDWQDILNRSGKCDAEMSKVNAKANDAYNQLKKPSVLVSTSMANISESTFSALPYQAVSEVRHVQLDNVNLRLLVDQIQTLKLMHELGYFEFVRGPKTNAASAASGELTLKETSRYLAIQKKIQTMTDLSQDSVGIEALIGSAIVLTSGLKSSPLTTEASASRFALGYSASMGITAGLSSVAVNSQENEKEELKAKILAKASADKTLNDGLNQQIHLAEEIYSLNSRVDYLNNKAALTSRYKNEFVLNLFLRQVDPTNSKNDLSYQQFLVAQRVIADSDFAEVAQIVELASQNQIVASNINQIYVQTNQVRVLKETVHAIAQDTTDFNKKNELLRLEKNLENEAEVLSLLR